MASSFLLSIFEDVKCKMLAISILLGMFPFMPSNIFAEVKNDSLVMDRLFSYMRNFAPSVNGFKEDFYLKYTFRTIKRNPTLFFVPTMYSIARGNRNYIGENIGTITFHSIDEFQIEQKTLKSTIPHNRHVMNVMMRFMIPNLYGISLFGDNMLSPFNYSNRIFYKYKIIDIGGNKMYITFTPKSDNTQLVKGFATVDRYTGRIIHTHFEGDYDMVTFDVNVHTGDNDSPCAILPRTCDTKARFKFMGNEIVVRFYANFNGDFLKRNSISSNYYNLQIDSIRPVPLEKTELAIYDEFTMKEMPPDTVSIERPKHKFMEKAWNVMDDYILNGQDAGNNNISISLSPLFNPLYMSYSNNRGLSYKMDIGARCNLSSTSHIILTPRLGYNFRIKQFFFNAPLRYTFDTKRNGWVELRWSNGNRITNSSVLDIIKTENRDTIDFSSLNLDYFTDEEVNLSGNFRITKCLDLFLGCVFHKRTAVNRAEMEQAGKPSVYRSFAPAIKLTFSPSPYLPTFTANYERALIGVLNSNIKYERWEFDASFKKVLRRLQQYNLRIGGGFYTNKSTDYFVDFANFHEVYLPDGWDDDWTGDFQLLNSAWYNASRYYFRTNVSYASPLLLLTWIPFVGRYIETERTYVNFLQIEHTRPYTEIGYSLTNRYFSVGLFSSFLNGSFHEIGSKFSFELFRKW